jgi:hypothetical protein
LNTPAHAVVNLAVLGDRVPRAALPVLAGAVLPDVPMLVFYGWEKLMLHMPEGRIWGHDYFVSAWQPVIDGLHSFPLALLGFAAAWALRSPRAAAFFASLFLHSVGDFPLHHDDAHRHFFPFSDWRFASPVSYWDPRHYGLIVGPLELAAVLAGCIVLFRRYESRAARTVIAGVMTAYGLYLGYVLWVWA